MSNNENLSRAQKALAAVREIARENARSEVGSIICFLHPCFSYILLYEHCCSWSPTLDIAVRLLESAAHELAIDNGQVNWQWGLSDLTNEELQAGRCSVEECAEALRVTSDPFAFAYHIPGETSVRFHYGGQSRSSAIGELASGIFDEIAFELRGVGNVVGYRR